MFPGVHQPLGEKGPSQSEPYSAPRGRFESIGEPAQTNNFSQNQAKRGPRDPTRVLGAGCTPAASRVLMATRKRSRPNMASSVLERQTRRARDRKSVSLEWVRDATARYICRMLVSDTFSRDTQVPKRMRVRLRDILDEQEDVKNSVVLAFSLCGNFLLSYRVTVDEGRARYFLEWWTFRLSSRLSRAARVELFSGLAEAASPAAEILEYKGKHMPLTLVQPRCGECIVVLAHAGSSRATSSASRVNLLSIVPVRAALNGLRFATAEVAFCSYRPHAVLSPQCVISCGAKRYCVVLSTTAGIHALAFDIQRDGNTAVSEISATRTEHCGCFSVNSPEWLLAHHGVEHERGADRPRTFAAGSKTQCAGVVARGHVTVDIERFLVKAISAKLSIHNYAIKLYSAMWAEEEGPANGSPREEKAQTDETVHSRADSTTNLLSNLRSSWVLALETIPARSAATGPAGGGGSSATTTPSRASTHAYHIGVDFGNKTVTDLKYPKVNIPGLLQRNPQKAPVDVVLAAARRVVGSKRMTSGVDWGPPAHPPLIGRGTAAPRASRQHVCVVCDNSAIFRGTPVSFLRHPFQPMALFF